MALAEQNIFKKRNNTHGTNAFWISPNLHV